MIAAACAQLGERALVGAAGTDYSNVPHFDHVKVVGTVNFATVFPACRAVVHHGGSSTTPIAMRAGVPQLILFWDLVHAVYGAAVKRLKVGTARRFSTASEESLVADLRTILAPQYVARARELATRMTEPAKSAAAAADLLEDFARLAACWLIGDGPRPLRVAKRHKLSHVAGHRSRTARTLCAYQLSIRLTGVSPGSMVWNLLHLCRVDGGETRLSINPFDDGWQLFRLGQRREATRDDGRSEMTDLQKRALPATETKGESFAIVGYALRLPGAADADEFWDVLSEGRDAISEVPSGPVGCRRILRPGSRRAREDRYPPGGLHR